MKNIQIGNWDAEPATISVEDNCTIQQALQMANLQPTRTQTVTSYSTSLPVQRNEIVSDGEVYLLTGNQISGR